MKLQEKITYCFIKQDPEVFILDKDHIAFKENKCYPVYVSERLYEAPPCLGSVRVVFNENTQELLASALPLRNLNNGFELINLKFLEEMEAKAIAFREFKDNHLLCNRMF